MNIYEKMAAITAELRTVAKNLNVQAGKNQSYKAVGERDVLDAVKPLEQKFGVYSYPCYRDTLESERLESESTYNGQVSKKTTFYTRLKTVYRFVNVEKPDEFLETTVFSVGIDSQDKGDGKAMTYGDKYALMKAYKISTGDDPDQEASADEDYRRVKKAKPEAPKADTGYEKFLERAGDTEYFICSTCKQPSYPFTKKDGSVMSARDMLMMSLRDYGEPLCKDCYKARRAAK